MPTFEEMVGALGEQYRGMLQDGIDPRQILALSSQQLRNEMGRTPLGRTLGSEAAALVPVFQVTVPCSDAELRMVRDNLAALRVIRTKFRMAQANAQGVRYGAAQGIVLGSNRN